MRPLREIFHILTKSGKVVGPSEPTLEDIELAVKHANERPEALIYGPYRAAKYQLVGVLGVNQDRRRPCGCGAYDCEACRPPCLKCGTHVFALAGDLCGLCTEEAEAPVKEPHE